VSSKITTSIPNKGDSDSFRNTETPVHLDTVDNPGRLYCIY
jgi:hypothetical protein